MKHFIPLFLIITLFLGISCNPSVELNRNPNHLLVHILNEPPSLHPISGRTFYRSLIMGFTHQMLTVIQTETGKIGPELAAGLAKVSENGLEHRYEVLENAAWPDGHPIGPADILFSMKLIACDYIDAPNRRPAIEPIAEITLDPENPSGLIFTMKEPSINNLLVGAATYVLDKRRYDPNGLLDQYSYSALIQNGDSIQADQALMDWATDLNDPKYGKDLALLDGGSGPYYVEDWIAGQQIILAPRENYWGKDRAESNHAQGPEKIVFKFLSEDKSVELQFKQQELDVSFMLTTSTFNELNKSDSVKNMYKLDQVDRNNFAFIALNNKPDGVKHPPFFEDAQVRTALNEIIPIQQIIDDIFPNSATRIGSPIPSYHPDHNENLTLIPYNLESGQKKLSDAGWVDSDGDQILDKMIDGRKVPFSFTMIYPPNGQAMIDLAERISASLKAAGIECILRPERFSAQIREEVWTGDYDAILLALTVPATPYNFTQIFHSSNWLEGDNFMGYDNPRSDSLMDLANVTQDPIMRKAIVDEIQEILYQDMPCVFFFSSTRKIIVHNRYGAVDFYSNDPFVILNTLAVQ